MLSLGSLSIPLFARSGSGSAPTYPLDLVGGVGPVYAYSTKKLTAAYSGPALRVIRISDSVEQDIGFSGQNIDGAALDAFLAATTGFVLNYYDQSGNGNHQPVQSNAGLRPYITKLIDRGWAVVDLGGQLVIPASVSLNSRAFDAFNVIEPVAGALSGVLELGSPFTSRTFMQQSRYQGTFGSTTDGRVQVHRPMLLEMEGSATRQMFAQNSEQNVGGALGSTTMLGGLDGGLTLGGYYQLAYRGAAIGYGRVLSAGEKTAMQGAIGTLYSTSVNQTRRFISVGDSITAGGNAPTLLFYNGYASQVGRQLPADVGSYTYSSGGQTLQTFLANFATTTGAVLDLFPGDSRVVFLHMGTNDLTVSGRTAAQIYADTQSYAGLVRAKGAKIVVSTLLPDKTWNGTQQTTRNDLNTLIRTNWASFADGFADVGADPTIGPQAAASNTALYMDGLHPSQLGHSYFAPIALAAITPLL